MIAMIAMIGKNRAATMPMTIFSRIQAATTRIRAASTVRPNDLLEDSSIAAISLDGNGPDGESDPRPGHRSPPPPEEAAARDLRRVRCDRPPRARGRRGQSRAALRGGR